MNIAIICTEEKPVPATKGGAVESIIEDVIKCNNSERLFNIDIYSIFEETAEKLVRNDESYHFIKNISNKYENLLNVISLKINLKFLYKNKFIENVISLINLKTYDWIIVENRPFFIMPLRKKITNKFTKIALHMHNDCFINKKIDTLVYNQYDLILTVSDYVKRNILNNAKVSEKKVKVWFNSVDTKKFRLHNGYSDITKKAMQKYNLYSGKVIMFHGRLLPEKGVLEVILAFKKVLNLLPDLRLCILGELQQDNDYHKLLIKTAGALMNKQIIFTGYISYKEIEHYLNIATIFVLPSLWEEPCGLAMLEALAMEKPLITTNSGGIVETASNNTGFILEKDQSIVENIFQKIVWLINNPEVSREMGKYARREIIKKRNLEYYLSNLNTILESY